MVIFLKPRLILKLLLVLPATWFVVVLLIGLHEKGQPAKENDARRVFKQPDFKAVNEVVEAGDELPRVATKLPDLPGVPREPPEVALEPPKKVDSDVEIQRHRQAHERNSAQDMDDKAVLLPPKAVEGPGEMGKPVELPKTMSPEMQKVVDEGWQNNAFNQYASDLISIHRSLPDMRDEHCRKPGKYLSNLPDTSVIICFHNEAWSVLIRTVHSVMDRSPDALLKEVILVDDASTMDHLKSRLDEYVLAHPKLKVLRSPQREGLIRARLRGAAHAVGQVLTYLDSHCECTEGWLEPMLDRIARNSTTVVCPVIDVIDDNTLEYMHRDAMGTNVGGFDWNLQFNWHGIPDREKKRRSHASDPVWSPTMAGGLFAIDRQYFEHLGTYDSGFDIWGGENLELSFKIWMCGGTLEIIPCSHVGHIFRKRSPYQWRTGVNVLKRNSIRLAEVWLDDFKQYYYQRIGYDLGDYGDVSPRKELREKLKCHSFDWYLKNVYPELFVPGEALASGEVRNLGEGSPMCLDSPARKQDLHKPMSLYPCHRQGGNQFWMLSKAGEIRRDESCLDFAGADVILYPCHGSKGNQHWEYNHATHTIKHVNSNKCLELAGVDRTKLAMQPCNESNSKQHWQFQTYNTPSTSNS